MLELTLKYQLCFPMYALSRQVTALYRPLLEPLGLTYPQYLILMLMWEHKKLTVKEIGKELWLDSGTLTPLLKRMEEKGLVERIRDKSDERVVNIHLTESGMLFRNECLDIPSKIQCQLNLNPDQAVALRSQLYELLEVLDKQGT
ncbi:DNA-binding transcriptional regulator, MarR family [Pseudarcicella hirudinis]|uniref:DNA-binding transcriptional regulator, MarR family n=1 Tax=Pseudarcicella hirudinis TaxID=1079859 RepID=A0A1I5TRG2_9BACT|nr:MarR family transcriptional regulator [Pseudarcicella hirudinis]SFP85654.1 DNA-binding transcriptional regulator, MarR family [Pseudarcicella hirudinis]